MRREGGRKGRTGEKVYWWRKGGTAEQEGALVREIQGEIEG